MTQKTTDFSYSEKKKIHDGLITIYGRKPVLEALQDSSNNFYKLHLSNSNKPGGIIDNIVQLAKARSITIEYHEKKALSRISKNGKQDQGVAGDIKLANYRSIDDYLIKQKSECLRLIALDSIENPKNLGMIIRAACAGGVDGILIPKKGCASLSPLVIKASSGSLFKAPLVRCDILKDTLQRFQEANFNICALSPHASESLFEYKPQGSVIYILGNESEGVSADIFKLADKKLMIPMNNNIESLNVAMTATLIAFSSHL